MKKRTTKTAIGNIRLKCLDFDARKNPKTRFFCCRCQRDMKPHDIRYWLHFLDENIYKNIGFPFILHPTEEKKFKKEEILALPIGVECVKKVGMEWVHEERKATGSKRKRGV